MKILPENLSFDTIIHDTIILYIFFNETGGGGEVIL